MEKVTVGIVNYNGMATLPATIAAVKALDYPSVDIIVADNNSADGSREWVQQTHPDVCCLALERNRGLPGARNAILNATDTPFVFIIDNDITPQPDVLTRLLDVMRTNPDAAVCHPEIVDATDPNVHRYNGGTIHYLCALVERDGPDAGAIRPKTEPFDVISGGALLIRRAAAATVGNFDADYFFNWEDGDFTARLTLAGYRCLNVPAAVVQHVGKPRGASRVYHMVRNRWYFILKLYAWRTIVLILPALLLFELSQAAFALLNGALGAYVRGNGAAIRALPTILRKRRAFQRLKRKRDRDWLHAGDLYIPPAMRKNALLHRLQRVYIGVLNGYWRLIRPLC
jgi:GT2 family glycosyltransferase